MKRTPHSVQLYCGTFLLTAASIFSPQLRAQETDQTQGEAVVKAAQDGAGQVYDPSYFAQFAPRTALDMIEQIPGFQASGGGGGNSRGLGQANQNVLINGERLSSKSDSVQDQLRRIPSSDVVRIEIVDGTSLDVTGLSGQVANVIVDLTGIAGSFSWKGRYRGPTTGPEWYGGEISVAGTSGDLSFTVALDNPNNRFGSNGPTIVSDADGNLIQIEETRRRGQFDKPTLTVNLGYDFGRDIIANLNASYARTFFRRFTAEDISGPLVSSSDRSINYRERGYEYEIGGDLSFPLGSGSLKLIGLERYDTETGAQTVIETFDDPQIATTGSRFLREDGLGERIGRAEYDFPFIGAQWQIAGEAAFNRLDRLSGLFELGTDGEFIELDFPEGTGGVTEDRYEISASFSKRLSEQLSFQATVAYEFSTLKQTGSAANNRSFKRPKGSASLAWNNDQGLDITLTAERSVGQLSFGDFLARVNLDDENGSAGNNELVPAQTWEAELEVNKTLGAWGSTSFVFEQRWIEDFLTLIPLDDLSGEARGNLPSARRTEIEWTTTLKFDPIGWRGAQLDLRLEYEEGEFRDPLTGELFDFSRGRDREADVDLRHDIPGTSFAYGGGVSYGRDRRFFRLAEFNRAVDGPTFARVFVEHKDVLGLTARATLGNLLDGRDSDDRVVFDGPRNAAPVLFTEERDRKIGLIVRFDVSGNF